MKKPLAVIAAALVLALASSCVTTKIWDETHPPEKSATIFFYQITPKSYNEIGVSKWHSVVIPAGEAVIGGDVHINHAGVGFLAKDMEFVCHLEAEKEYSVIGATKDGKWGVNLYESKNLKAETLVTFIPFTTQPDTFK
jgi:hypothetical protein